MAIFYNTNNPTPSSLNTINSVSMNIRDFLLTKNISSTYPQIGTSINGSPQIGEPVLDTQSNLLNTYPHQQLTGDIQAIQNLDVLGSVLNGQGIGLGSKGIVPNFDIRGSLAGRILGATGLLSDTKIGTIAGQQLALALANNATFNVEQSLFGKLNAADNLLSLVKNGTLAGFRPDYKITVPSSTIGVVGEFTSRMLGFTVPRSYLNDSGSIFQNENKGVGNIERANSMLLNTGKGQVLSLLKNIKSNIGPIKSVFRSGYAPGFTNNKGVRQISEEESNVYAFDKLGQNINLLSNSIDGIIPDLMHNSEDNVSNYGFTSPEMNGTGPYGNIGYDNRKVSDIGFTWTTNNGDAVNTTTDNDEIIGDKKSLLVKTQQLFNSKGLKSMISVKGDMKAVSNQLQTTNGGGLSKGSAVLSGSMYKKDGTYVGNNSSANDTYCRSWTTLDRYDTVNKLIRNNGLDENSVYGKKNIPYRFQTEGSVLDTNGFPKIAPYRDDQPEDPKKFMFSLENLAWSDNIADLPQSEIGSGDIANDKKGRIMWFPPYDITFSENNSVNWESTNFIGRGEPIYTYNNTERSGTLGFKVIVDHPSNVNAFRGDKGPSDNYVASYFAGCVEPNKFWRNKLTINQTNQLINENTNTPQSAVITKEKAPDIKIIFYFPNDNAIIPNNYENGLSGPLITDLIDYTNNPRGDGYGIDLYKSDGFTSGIHQKVGWYDNTNFGLNASSQYSTGVVFNGVTYMGLRDVSSLMVALNTYINDECPSCVVNISGYASEQGVESSNNRLIKSRGEYITNILKGGLFKKLTDSDKNKRFKIVDGGIIKSAGCKVGVEEDIDQKACKEARRVEVTFKFDANIAAESIVKPNIKIKTENKSVSQKIINEYYNETLYFDRLKESDPFVFDSFREKIKYFHPAFHSTTPEGLNSRLNFLLQCTRQGPTSELQGPNNLAFGRAPVCILRIGDFYNTKIVIDNIGITYEPLVWDLNPEGIGVQPMIAVVDITFKFLGGSALMGPMNKLQNALSFNYFANTQVYDPRADYLSKKRPSYKTKTKDGKEITVNAKETISGYYINDGQKGGVDSRLELPRPEIVVDDIDQIKINDEIFTGLEITPTDVTDVDKKININVSFVGIRTYEPEIADGTVYLKITTPVALTSEYSFKLVIFDTKNNPKDIGIGKLSISTTEQVFAFNTILNIDNFSITSDVNTYQYKLEITNLKPVSGTISL